MQGLCSAHTVPCCVPRGVFSFWARGGIPGRWGTDTLSQPRWFSLPMCPCQFWSLWKMPWQCPLCPCSGKHSPTSSVLLPSCRRARLIFYNPLLAGFTKHMIPGNSRLIMWTSLLVSWFGFIYPSREREALWIAVPGCSSQHSSVPFFPPLIKGICFSALAYGSRRAL